MARRKLISVTNFSGSRDRSEPTFNLALTLFTLVLLMATQQCNSVGIPVADRGQRQKLSLAVGGDGGPETGKLLAATANETVGAIRSSSKGESQPQTQTKIKRQSQSQTLEAGEKDKKHFDETRKPQESASALGGGQLEAFSTEWTGLGDMEASDALKKMNRRSLYESGPLPAADRLSSFRVLRGRQRPGPTSIPSKRAQLYALQKQQQVEAPTNDRLLGPIVLSRRTSENLLDQSQQQQQQQVRVDDTEDKETFPLFGEFGSKISSLTTRKTEPSSGVGSLFGTYKARGFGGPMNYGVWSSNDNDNDENLPILAQLLVSPQRLDSIRESVEDALAAVAGRAGSGSVPNEAARFSWNGEISKPETVSTILESLSSNYLPRIARKAPHSLNMDD